MVQDQIPTQHTTQKKDEAQADSRDRPYRTYVPPTPRLVAACLQIHHPDTPNVSKSGHNMRRRSEPGSYPVPAHPWARRQTVRHRIQGDLGPANDLIPAPQPKPVDPPFAAPPAPR